MPRLALIWIRLRDALWSLPIAMVFAAIVLAILALRVDISPGSDPVWWLYGGNAQSASGFIANLLTAMITLATLAISITMVVLALAAQSLGPRLIPIFMGDNRTKAALGLFIGTAAYLLLVMRTVASNNDAVPNVAISVGALLVLTSVVVLLLFVHHLARSIVADTVIESVGQSLDDLAASLLPEATEADGSGELAGGGPSATIRVGTSGYIQAIDHDAIVAAACRAEARVAIGYRAGHFVLAGDTLATISPEEAADDALADAVSTNIVIGATRTPVQDIEYAVRQLVEVALRALSSGINDAFTACAVIDRLAASLGIVMARGRAQAVWRDKNGVARLSIAPLDFAGILDAAFNQIRQAGAGQPAILIRLADRLGQLARISNVEQAAVIADHIGRVRDTARRTVADAADLTDTEQRVAAALADLPGGPSLFAPPAAPAHSDAG